VFLGNAHGAEPDTRSEGTDIDEPLSPSAREIGFSFSKNASLSALAQSPPERLSPSKEEALKDELSPVTEVPSDIRKLKFNIGASPSDFIMEENECEDVQQQHFQKLFKPISESGESEELETVLDSSKPPAATAYETVGQSLKSAELGMRDTGQMRGSHDAEDASDEEQDVLDDGSRLDRMTLLSFDNIAYEDPVLESDLRDVDQAKQQQVHLDVPGGEERSGKQHGRHRISISSDSDSDMLLDTEMVDIQSTLRTEFESTPASKLAESLGFDQSEEMQYAAWTDDKENQRGIVLAEPHELIRGTHDAEVLSAIESQRSSAVTIGSKQPDLFDFSETDTLMVSAPADDVMKMSTSSDASAEATILAATYDLDLGAVSRVVATYDMSPDSVDKAFVIDKQSKVLQSSPDDEVFETTDGGAKSVPPPPTADDSLAAADEFDTNDILFGLVKADDVDRYEAYLEVMQQHRAVADQDLGALLDLGVCAPCATGEPSCGAAVETSSPVTSTVCMQPDLIQGMPRNVDDDIPSSGIPSHTMAEEPDQSEADDELITVYDVDSESANAKDSEVSQCRDNRTECSSSWDTFNQQHCENTACENVPNVPASFGKGALDSDNMYQVFQQDTSNSPGGDDVLASCDNAFSSGLHYEKQADDTTDGYQYPLKRKLDIDRDEDYDSDFLAESAEPELMALSVEKEDEECGAQVSTLDYSDDCQAASAGGSDSWRVLDSRCLDRPLSPLPDNEYRILDDSDDAYAAGRVMRSSTGDSDVGMESPKLAFKQFAGNDNLRREQAAAIVSHVVAGAKAAAENDDGNAGISYPQDADIDEGFFQAEVAPDLIAKDMQSSTLHEEVDDVDEGVLPEDQLCHDDDTGDIYQPIQSHLHGHYVASGETVSKSPDADNLIQFDGECVQQKASEFVSYLVKEAQVEAENVADRSQEAGGESLTDFSRTDLCRVEEVCEEHDAEITKLDHDMVSSEGAAMLSYEHTETSRSEEGTNGAALEWNATEQTSLDDYGDSSSVDSFATVVPCHQEAVEDRMEDLASVSSSFHSDLHSSYLEDQPEPMVSLDARDEDLMLEGEIEDSSGSEHFVAMRDDLDSSVVEMIPCCESPDDDKYGMFDDDFDHPMMMTLATIKEEDERSSTSGKSGKTGSSSERVDATDSDKQASSGDLHAEYPCRRMVGKSSDKDDVSVSSSLLEFETLEKEMQDRTSLDSLAKLGSQQSVAEKSSEASSSLLEFERIEKEMQDRTSHDSLTKLGSLHSVAEKGSEKDNVSVSSSLAEFERLEREIDVVEPALNISAHVTYGMVGSTTSLNAFLMDDSAHQAVSVTRVSHESLGFDEQFESEARAVVSMLEAGALPIMHDRISVNADAESSGAGDTELMPAARDGQDVDDAGLPVYPEYQDIVQIIRKASETAHEGVDGSKRSYRRPEPDVDSLNDAEMGDEVAAAEARDPWDGRGGMDTDSLQDYGESQIYDTDQVVPSCDRDVMETSADSIEGVPEQEAAALERSADSLELRAALAPPGELSMHQSIDSLGAEDRRQDSFDADSLHESSTPAAAWTRAEVLMASVESGAWSQSDSLLSTTAETLKSSGSSQDDSMRMSPDSPNPLISAVHATTTVAASTSCDTDHSDSCYCHADVVSLSSTAGVAFPSRNGNHIERASGN